MGQQEGGVGRAEGMESRRRKLEKEKRANHSILYPQNTAWSFLSLNEAILYHPSSIIAEHERVIISEEEEGIKQKGPGMQARGRREGEGNNPATLPTHARSSLLLPAIHPNSIRVIIPKEEEGYQKERTWHTSKRQESRRRQ